jgi:hypothetical protein
MRGVFIAVVLLSVMTTMAVAATGLLKAFSDEVAAQRGARIPRVEADGLVEFAGEVLELLEEQ